MKQYKEIERKIIEQIVQEGYGHPAYIVGNVYYEYLSLKNIGFFYLPSPHITFYLHNVNDATQEFCSQVKSDLSEISLLIESLENEGLIHFVSPNKTNSLVDINNLDQWEWHKVELALDQHIGDIVFKCLNNEVVISEDLKILAEQFNRTIYIPRREIDTHLYFEKQKKNGRRSDCRDSVVPPKHFPGFVLCHNHDWDDNTYHNWYCLHFFNDEDTWHMLGELHLMSEKGESSWEQLPESFTMLSEDFCSLGNNVAYYKRIRNVLGENLAFSVLYALQDCAISCQIFERYRENHQFQASLMREQLEAEKSLRLARYVLYNKDITEAYKFVYIYHPPYNLQSETEWEVDFIPSKHSFLRCAGVIGENGVGKTQMLKAFVQDLLSHNEGGFKSQIPIYQ